jgi:hypothetical protein
MMQQMTTGNFPPGFPGGPGGGSPKQQKPKKKKKGFGTLVGLSEVCSIA